MHYFIVNPDRKAEKENRYGETGKIAECLAD